MSEVDLISFSSLVFISKTKRSSSEFVDLAAAYLENITSTLRTILSGSINMARVLASLASRETFISPFQRILIQKVFRKVESNNFLSGACGQSAPYNFTILIMSKNYDEQSHQSLPAQATYWFKLPTPNRTYLDFLFETDEEKAIKEFEKFVDIIEKKKFKKKEPEDA